MSNKGSWLSCTDGVAMSMQDLLILLARITFGLIFVIYALPKFGNFGGVATAYVGRGIPLPIAYLGPFVEFFGGLFIILGFAVRYSALLMIAFLLIATFTSHTYWTYPEAQMAAQKSNFFKNTAMLSGALMLFAFGGGRYSIDAMLGRNK